MRKFMIRRAGVNEKLEEVLDLLELSVEEKFAAAAFFNREAGEEILSQIAFRDLSVVPCDVVEKFRKNLVQKKRMDELARLFLVLFVRGESTCHPMFSKDHLELVAKTQGMDLAKVAAVYGAKVGQETDHNVYSIQPIFDIVKSSTKVLRQAIGFAKHDPGNGRLILLALYLRIEYQNRKPYLLGRRDKDGSPLPVTEVEEEDIPLLAEHESLAVTGLARLYFGCVGQPITKEALSELSGELGEGKIPKKLAPLIGAKPNANWTPYKIVVGLSYWNYMLSDKLKNIVKLCLAIDCQGTLKTLYEMSQGTSNDIAKKGGNYDEEFGIDTETYLCWAAKWNFKTILGKQLKAHKDCYLSLMEQLDIQESNNMLAVIREEDEALYKRVVNEKKSCAQYGDNPDREKLIAMMVKKVPNSDRAIAYLRGESKVDTIYHRKKLEDLPYSPLGPLERWHLNDYMKCYKDEEFLRRCEAYALLNNGHNFIKAGFIGCKNSKEYIIPGKVEKTWANLETEGVGLKWQLAGALRTYESLRGNLREEFFLLTAKIFAGYLKERREYLLLLFARADSLLKRLFALEVLSQDAEENKKEILAYLQDSSKAVGQRLFEILCGQKGFEEEVKSLLMSKRATEREFAVKVLSFWQEAGADYHKEFVRALEKEKSAKVKELLENALGTGETGSDGNGAHGMEAGATNAAKTKALCKTLPISRADLVKEIHRGGKKRGLAWAYSTPFSEVHFAGNGAGTAKMEDLGKWIKQGSVADEEYLQAIFLSYSSMDECGINKNAAYLAETLDSEEFALYVNELFDKWMGAGAEAKKRWVLYAAAIHGDSEMIEKIYRQIQEWPTKARGAIACEAVRALSLSPLLQALRIVDGIARKFKFRQVRAAAGEALAFAAKQRGITSEELADRIVPDFGFDEKTERVFDYGERKFIVTITPALEIEVFEANEASKGGENSSMGDCVGSFTRGKRRKTLPKPGKRDDEAKAAAAYSEFSQMKKKLLAVVNSQKQRLEMSLSTAREWSVAAWKQLFVKNPVMHLFATSLIWGIYKDGKLLQSFRYMEDGSFNTADGAEFNFPVSGKTAGGMDGKIRLVHPVELSAEEKGIWQQQLEDYEIVQPFEQLGRTVYMVTEKEADSQKLKRFADIKVNDLTLKSRLSALGWYRGMVKDAGCFFTYYREDKEIGFCVELHFSGSYVGGENEEVTIYSAQFYKVGEQKRGGFPCCDTNGQEACSLKNIPARYFSEIVWQLTKAVSQTGL
ncbi:MAG: DUF4132 domain-containing protein [Lachnospiraceae bacterium]|nr:DUF4132 domain-containing protein [Lachnospiraceae bacterium]